MEPIDWFSALVHGAEEWAAADPAALVREPAVVPALPSGLIATKGLLRRRAESLRAPGTHDILGVSH